MGPPEFLQRHERKLRSFYGQFSSALTADAEFATSCRTMAHVSSSIPAGSHVKYTEHDVLHTNKIMYKHIIL